jgi:glycosyltransferase involved in cell wall biosynthesis/8-oxo-dGTP pyrophosphatase MutT (NUDIX family)
MPSITFMIPALNEEKRIQSTLETVLGVLASQDGLEAQLLVIDDGSTDRTAAVVSAFALQHPEVTLLRHEQNGGMGRALRTALRHATSEKFVIVPGDNDMPASAIAALLQRAPDADLVMCYFPDRGDRGKARQFLSTLFGLIYASSFGIHLQYFNGPCVYPVARLRELELFSNRFSIIPEMNIKLLRQGASFLEIPGYRQTGLEGSTSLSLRNLRETMVAFLRLFYEIHLRHRSTYRASPRRVGVAPPSATEGLAKVGRWLAAGLGFMGLNTVFLFLFIHRLGMPVWMGTLAAAEVSTILRFFVNHHWVFDHGRPTWRQFRQYHIANVGALTIWWIATNVLTSLHVNYLVAGMLAVGFSTGFSMVSNFHWVWKRPPPARTPVQSVCGVVLLRKDGAALLQLRDAKAGIMDPGIWVVPGGHADPGESPSQAAAREFEEETCYRCSAPRPLVEFGAAELGYEGSYRFCFFWDDFDGTQRIECREGQALEFISRADADRLPRREYLTRVWDLALAAREACQR